MLFRLAISKVVATRTAITSTVQCLQIKSLLETDLNVKGKALILKGEFFNQGHSIEADPDVKGNALALQPGSPYPLEIEMRRAGNQPGCRRVW